MSEKLEMKREENFKDKNLKMNKVLSRTQNNFDENISQRIF
jgi:hypothetical protein